MDGMQHLSGRLAHTLNNVLTVVLGYEELLERQMGGEGKARDYLREIRDAAHRARALARDLEAYSGRRLLDRQAVDVGDLVRAVLPPARERLGPSTTLTVQLAPALPPADVDPVALERALLAVLDQVASFLSEPGPIAFETGLDTEPTQPPRVILRIRYPGPPLPGVVADRLFEPYALPKGSGPAAELGLAAAFGTVAQHGGWLEFQAGPRLHTFTLRLPIC
jgi:two-component system NtrC family sensor kinase